MRSGTEMSHLLRIFLAASALFSNSDIKVHDSYAYRI